MLPHDRRAFLKRAAATAGSTLATFTIAGTKASGRVLGANNRVRVAGRQPVTHPTLPRPLRGSGPGVGRKASHEHL